MPRKLNVGDKVIGSWSRAAKEQFTLLRHCDYAPTAWWMMSDLHQQECWAPESDLKFVSTPTFSLKFEDIDEAVEAATILAKHFNRAIPVCS